VRAGPLIETCEGAREDLNREWFQALTEPGRGRRDLAWRAARGGRGTRSVRATGNTGHDAWKLRRPCSTLPYINEDNQTWTAIRPPRGRGPVYTSWIFRQPDAHHGRIRQAAPQTLVVPS
jgi:hypothetical protein